ncbi:MAG TPA: hypothetical protein IAC50_06440 [Candidatus Copromorpha excrementigallinarum]|uniref:Uncharacterized protein n=1 Tax=Candidatus Allocopromorpha excrementigallinarum TaxID=2840742 RepID=A0A9D1I3A0_9FIRM|nr:hypothetical protein [Candidatus Copromorpha excrementigallinarum]
MRALKIIGAIIISAALLAGEVFLMAAFAFDRALSEESLRKAVEENNLVEAMVEEALRESTVSMGGEYGEMVMSVMRTDAMTDFFTDYVEAAIDHEIYGNPYTEIGTDQLMNAFTRGVEEVNSEGGESVSPLEEEFMKQELLREAPDITADLNSLVGEYDALGGRAAEEALQPAEGVRILTGVAERAAAVILCLICVAALAFMFRRSRLGLIWCAAATATAASAFMLLSAGQPAQPGVAELSSLENALLDMLTSGFRAAAAAGYITAAIFVIICVIMRAARRKKLR